MPPSQLMEKPNDLSLFPEGKLLKLSDIVDSVKNNYATSFENSTKLVKLQEWIIDQAKIFNEK